MIPAVPLVIAALFAMVVLGPPTPTRADTGTGPIRIEAPWARATAPQARAGAAFMTLTNQGTADDRLIAAEAEVSEVTELHTHINDDGIMRMREVPAIEVPADGAAVLAPGGLHVMFIGLTRPLIAGETLALTLRFERAGSVTVAVPVRPIGDPGPRGDHGGHHGGR